jgi:hypothetical protein
VREHFFCAFKGFYCLDLRLGIEDLFMHKKQTISLENFSTFTNYSRGKKGHLIELFGCKLCYNWNVYIKTMKNIFFARLYSIWLFTTSVSKMVSSVYSLLTINSMVSNFWCSRTVSKVYSKLIDYYYNFYVDGSWRQDVGALSGNS